MFDNAIELTRQYTEKLQFGALGGDVDVSKEIVLRLRQLKWLYERIRTIEAAYIAEYERKNGPLQPRENVVLVFLSPGVPSGTDSPFQPQEELRLLGEAFYNSAHRILVILKKCRKVLPGTKSIPARGVRVVRNNLIEHADGKGGHPCYTFSVSNAAGLRLRTASRPEDDKAQLDQGIHINAREFASQLEKVFETASA